MDVGLHCFNKQVTPLFQPEDLQKNTFVLIRQYQIKKHYLTSRCVFQPMQVLGQVLFFLL